MSPRHLEGGNNLKNKQTNSTNWAQLASLCVTLSPTVLLLERAVAELVQKNDQNSVTTSTTRLPSQATGETIEKQRWDQFVCHLGITALIIIAGPPFKKIH